MTTASFQLSGKRVGDKPVRGTQAFVTFIAQGIYCLNSSLMFNVVSSQFIFIGYIGCTRHECYAFLLQLLCVRRDFSFFHVRPFSAVQFISRSFFVYLCSSCQVFSLHAMHRASLVIFGLVLRCDSQSFRPVQSFILFGLFARPTYSSNLAIVLQLFCLFYLLFLQFAVLLSLGFVVILSSPCSFLIFVFQYRFGLFQIAYNRFVSVVERLDSIKLFVRKIKACKRRDFTSLLEPFAYSAWILYYHQYM